MRKLTKFSVWELTLLILLWKWILYIFCFLFSRFPITFMKFPLILYFFVTCWFFRRTILLPIFANFFLCCIYFLDSSFYFQNFWEYLFTIYLDNIYQVINRSRNYVSCFLTAFASVSKKSFIKKELLNWNEGAIVVLVSP